MTSTGTYQGLHDGRNSSKVLKPPGGGSSDIFGSASEVISPRRSKPNPNQSQLGSGFFGSGETASHAQTPSSNGSSAPETPRSKPGNDSYKRLFGPPDAPPPSTPNKNHMRSNIALGTESTTLEPLSPEKQALNNGSSNGHLANGNGYHQNDVVDGNPVTGAGYEPPQQNGSVSSISSGASDKSSTDSSPSAANATVRMKNRVPPGGFSSGLW